MIFGKPIFHKFNIGIGVKILNNETLPDDLVGEFIGEIISENFIPKAARVCTIDLFGGMRDPIIPGHLFNAFGTTVINYFLAREGGAKRLDETGESGEGTC